MNSSNATLHYPGHRYNTRYKSQVQKMGKPVFLAWTAGENKRILKELTRVRNEFLSLPFLLKKAWNLRWLPQTREYIEKLLDRLRTDGLAVLVPNRLYNPMIEKKKDYHPLMSQIKCLVLEACVYIDKFKKFYNI